MGIIGCSRFGEVIFEYDKPITKVWWELARYDKIESRLVFEYSKDNPLKYLIRVDEVKKEINRRIEDTK